MYLVVVFFPLQDQLSADMYSFVAKEIDYASYFQTVSTTSLQPRSATGEKNQNILFVHHSLSLVSVSLSLSRLADRSPGRVPQEVIRAASKCSAPDQSSSGWVRGQRTRDCSRVCHSSPISNPELKVCCGSRHVMFASTGASADSVSSALVEIRSIQVKDVLVDLDWFFHKRRSVTHV